MSWRLLGVCICLMICATGVAWAQSAEPVDSKDEELSFNLKPGGKTAQEQAADETEVYAYEPILAEKKIEGSVTLGFWNLGTTLISHDSLIYKYTDERTYYGDVELSGESAFNPQLRLSFNLFTWFALEPFFDISVSEYQSTIANRKSISNASSGGQLEPVEPEDIGEFDEERRSNITLGTGLNAIFYPRDYGNLGRGNFHPYLIGGASRVWMSINSDYVEESASMWRYSGGAGFRIIADDLISVRFEMLYNRVSFGFTPAESYLDLDEGQRHIPVYTYIPSEGAQIVEDFDDISYSSLSWALGFIAAF